MSVSEDFKGFMRHPMGFMGFYGISEAIQGRSKESQGGLQGFSQASQRCSVGYQDCSKDFQGASGSLGRARGLKGI